MFCMNTSGVPGEAETATLMSTSLLFNFAGSRSNKKRVCPGNRTALPNLPSYLYPKAPKCTLLPCLQQYPAEIRTGFLHETVCSKPRTVII
jgi:hypothetical protein